MEDPETLIEVCSQSIPDPPLTDEFEAILQSIITDGDEFFKYIVPALKVLFWLITQSFIIKGDWKQYIAPPSSPEFEIRLQLVNVSGAV